MFDPSIPPVRPGRPVRAASIDRLRQAAELGSRSRPSAGVLALESPSGRQERVPGPSEWPGTLTGSANPYRVVEAYGAPMTGWTPRPVGRTSALAYELNGATDLNNETVIVHPVGGGAWYWFTYTSQGSGGTGGGGTTLPGCLCDPIPSSLSMVSASETCNFGMFQSCSIAYGATPEGYLSLNIGLNCYLSSASFPDAIGGTDFRYLFTCDQNTFNLSRVYLESPYGSPYRDGLLYRWIVGGEGNSCGVDEEGNPTLSLSDGTPYEGSDADCSVTISG